MPARAECPWWGSGCCVDLGCGSLRSLMWKLAGGNIFGWMYTGSAILVL